MYVLQIPFSTVLLNEKQLKSKTARKKTVWFVIFHLLATYEYIIQQMILNCAGHRGF